VVNAIEYVEAITGTRVVRHSKIARPMSALGQKVDIPAHLAHVRFTPKSGHHRSANKCPLCADFVAKGSDY
jgi:hypothetical protein